MAIRQAAEIQRCEVTTFMPHVKKWFAIGIILEKIVTLPPVN